MKDRTMIALDGGRNSSELEVAHTVFECFEKGGRPSQKLIKTRIRRFSSSFKYRIASIIKSSRVGVERMHIN